MKTEGVGGRMELDAGRSAFQREPRIPSWLGESLLVGGAGLTALVAAALVWGVGTGDWSLPWHGGDMATAYAMAENMSRGHWYLRNSDLGYPYFQDQGHFPVTDLVPVAMIALLAWLVPSAIAAVNIFTALTFLSVAGVTTGAFRFLGAARFPAFVSGVCFSLLPWHFDRATGHIFLAHYVSVPLMLVLIGALARGRLDRGSPRLFAACLVSALVVAWNGVYYALMASLLLAGTLLFRWVRPPRKLPGWRSLLVAAVVPVAVVAAIVVNRVSTVTEETGVAVVRSLADSVLYGGLVSSLFYPATPTVLGQRMAIPIDNGNLENYAAMSSAAVIAVLISSWMVLYRWTSRAEIPRNSVRFAADYWPAMFIAVTAFMAMGGLGVNFAAWVSDLIRAWGRYSIVAVGIAFLIWALAVTTWSSAGSRTLRTLARGLPLVFLLLTLLDYSNGAYRMDFASPRALAAEADSFVETLEERLPEGCPVLELPLVLYPESPPVNNMADYSHLWPYIYSTDLRWSYGGVKGTTEGEWGFDSATDLDALAAKAAKAGFCGAQVDTASFATPADAAAYVAALGYPDVRSENGRWLFFDLTGLLPGEVVVQGGEGFAEAEADAKSRPFWWLTAPTGRIAVLGSPNSDGVARIRMFPPPCGPAQVTIGTRQLSVSGERVVDVPVIFDSSGRATVVVGAQPACSVESDPRQLYVGLSGDY